MIGLYVEYYEPKVGLSDLFGRSLVHQFNVEVMDKTRFLFDEPTFDHHPSKYGNSQRSLTIRLSPFRVFGVQHLCLHTTALHPHHMRLYEGAKVIRFNSVGFCRHSDFFWWCQANIDPAPQPVERPI